MTPSSRRSSQRRTRARKAVALGVGLLRRVDQVLADLRLELLPDRRHRLLPRGEIFLVELLDLRLAGFRDLLLVALVDVLGELVAVHGRLVHRLLQSRLDVGWKAVPPLGV